MEALQIGDASSSALEKSKIVEAETTSIRYKAPACEDHPDTPEVSAEVANLPVQEQVKQDPTGQGNSKSHLSDDKAARTSASSVSRSSVTWLDPPATMEEGSQVPSRKTKVIAGVTPKSRRDKIVLTSTLRSRSPSPLVRPPTGRRPNDPSKSSDERRPRRRPELLDYDPNSNDVETESSNEEEDDEWGLLDLMDEIAPEDSASRPRVSSRHRPTTRHANTQPAQHRKRSPTISVSREGRRTPRQRPFHADFDYNNWDPFRPPPAFPGYPDYTLPYPSMPSGPYLDGYMAPIPNPHQNPFAPPLMLGTTAIPPPLGHYPPPRYPLPSFPPRGIPQPAATVPPPLRPASPPPPPAVVPVRPEPARDVDPIALVEAYLGTLKETKEKELLDASRILSWIGRRSGSNDELLRGPDVMSFQVQDDESDVSVSRASSLVTSYANTPRVAQSTAEMPSRNINFSGQTLGRQRVESLSTDSVETSTGSLYSDNTVRQSGPSGYTAQNGLLETPERSRVSQSDISPATIPSLDGTLGNPAQKSLQLEIEALREDVTVLRQQLDQKDAKWFSSTLSTTYARWKKHFRKAPRPGTQRLEWTCECGEELFADLPLTDSMQYQQMLSFLTRPAPAARPAGSTHATSYDLESGQAPSNISSPNLSQTSFSNGKSPAPASTLGSGSTFVGSSSSQTFTLPPNGVCPRNKYLELCVNVGKYETKLAEIQVTSSSATGSTICTDAHLFRKIHDRYFALRQHTWRRFFYRPSGIRFVHFGVQAGHRVGFFSGNPLPSEEVITAKLYEYNLQPPVPPPIDSRTFLHYFWKHSALTQSTSARYVDRLPKKVGDSLVRALGVDELREGWGIYILEGPNKAAISWALLAVLVVSFGVALGYDIITKAGDSGFAIGQWVVAALSVALSALYFSLEDEVNSSFD